MGTNEGRTIDIYEDLTCKSCGKKGASKAGLCLECAYALVTGVRIVDQHAMVKAVDQCAGLIAQHWREIILARNAAAVEAGRQGKDKFSYSVALTIRMEPKGHECAVSTSIGYSVKHADTTETATVSDQPELAGLAEGGKVT